MENRGPWTLPNHGRRTKKKDGRDAEIRTRDPLTPSQVRYQAALHPADVYFFFVLLLPATAG